MTHTGLFSPITLSGCRLANRVVVAPMCQYSADTEGNASDWHSLHWGQYGLSNAGLMLIEATGVEPRGRITPWCLGLWSDANADAIARRLAPVLAHARTPFGIQLGHAGRKASLARPWDRAGHVTRAEGGWQPIAPSAIPFAEGWLVPRAMTEADMDDVLAAFAAAARRAARLGLAAIEVHAAHGYLLSSFLSPLANRRDDAWGGTPANRMRFPLAVFEAVRAAVPSDMPVGVRFNGTDWRADGLAEDEVLAFARALAERGCDFLDLSTGGNGPAKIPVGPGYQVPFAVRARAVSGLPTIAVGMIRSPLHAEALIAGDQVDMVALGRGFLNDPRWVWHAAEALGVPLDVAPQYGFGATSTYRPTPGR